MDHIYKLRPDTRMLIWLAGFDQHGKWTPRLAQQALTKYPCSSSKNKKKMATTPQKKTSTKDSHPKTNTGPTQSLQSPPSHRVLRQFPLNQAHAIRGTPDKLFSAYFVPYDGHCLFKAFKEALGLDASIQELRAQVVRVISDEGDPAIRISALNAHISREAEHRNPAWQNIALLDAGTVNRAGELDIQFSHLWVQYADEMSSNAWAGD